MVTALTDNNTRGTCGNLVSLLHICILEKSQMIAEPWWSVCSDHCWRLHLCYLAIHCKVRFTFTACSWRLPCALWPFHYGSTEPQEWSKSSVARRPGLPDISSIKWCLCLWEVLFWKEHCQTGLLAGETLIALGRNLERISKETSSRRTIVPWGFAISRWVLPILVEVMVNKSLSADQVEKRLGWPSYSWPAPGSEKSFCSRDRGAAAGEEAASKAKDQDFDLCGL